MGLQQYSREILAAWSDVEGNAGLRDLVSTGNLQQCLMFREQLSASDCSYSCVYAWCGSKLNLVCALKIIQLPKFKGFPCFTSIIHS